MYSFIFFLCSWYLANKSQENWEKTIAWKNLEGAWKNCESPIFKRETPFLSVKVRSPKKDHSWVGNLATSVWPESTWPESAKGHHYAICSYLKPFLIAFQCTLDTTSCQMVTCGEDPVAKALEWLHAIENNSVQYPNKAIARDAWKGREYQRPFPKTVKWSLGTKPL